MDGEIAAVRAAERLWERPPILPEQRAGGGVERLDHVAGVGQIHHAVVDERGRLVAAVAHRPDPGELQVADIVAVDLVERAVAPSVVGPPIDQPVVRVGIQQHRVGDRGALGDRPEQSRARLRAGGRPRVARPARGRRGAAERRGPRRDAVLLEDVGDDARVRVRRQRARGARRHRGAHEIDQLAGRPVAPRGPERRTGQLRRLERPAQVGHVARRARLLVRRPARVGPRRWYSRRRRAAPPRRAAPGPARPGRQPFPTPNRPDAGRFAVDASAPSLCFGSRKEVRTHDSSTVVPPYRAGVRCTNQRQASTETAAAPASDPSSAPPYACSSPACTKFGIVMAAAARTTSAGRARSTHT